jgi:hypothetical protein
MRGVEVAMGERVVRWIGWSIGVGAIVALLWRDARSTPAELPQSHDDCVRSCPKP